MARASALIPVRLRGVRVVVVLLVGVGLSGCGSLARSELPAPARPDGAQRGGVPSVPPDPRTATDGGPLTIESGRTIATLDARAREVVLRDARTREVRHRVPAGVGPTAIAIRGLWLFVVDTGGDALLVVRLGEDPQVVRRVMLLGRPAGIAVDTTRYRLWVALSARDEVVALQSHGRPSIQARLPTVDAPRRVGVASDGRVVVAGPGGARAVYDPPTQ